MIRRLSEFLGCSPRNPDLGYSQSLCCSIDWNLESIYSQNLKYFPHDFIHEIWKILVGVFLKTKNDHLFDSFRGNDSILKVQKRKSEISIWCTWKILLNRYIPRSPTPHYATADSFRAIRWNESLEIHQIDLFSLVFLWLSFFRKLKRINLQTVGYDHTVKENVFSVATRNISFRQWNQPTTQNPVELLHARTAFLSGKNHTD